jgi:hypothetical protein
MGFLGSLAAGCAGDGTGLGGEEEQGVKLSTDIQPIFTASCAVSGCHVGSSPPEGMNLSQGMTFANTVDVKSRQSALDRVEPSNPDLSYLVHKIQGTQSNPGVGGTLNRMPRNTNPLPQSQIDLIRLWITEGAKNN